MSNNFTSFDNFFDEAQEAPKGFELKGHTYTLPPQLPASVMLRFTRRNKGTEEEQTQAAIESYECFFLDMLGEEQYKRLLDTGITLQGLVKVFKAIMAIYDGKSETSPKAKK